MTKCENCGMEGIDKCSKCNGETFKARGMGVMHTGGMHRNGECVKVYGKTKNKK